MSYHRITVIGHTGSDPVHQVTQTGKDFTYFPVYVNEQVGDSERTTRYKIKTWNNLSLVAKEHLRTGQMVVIEGIPEVEAWQDNEGKPRAQMVVTARTMRFLGPKPAAVDEEEVMEELV